MNRLNRGGGDLVTEINWVEGRQVACRPKFCSGGLGMRGERDGLGKTSGGRVSTGELADGG